MRPVLRLAVCSAILLACHRPAPPAAFEGEIELEVNGIYTFLVSVKGDKSRIETSKLGTPVLGPMIVDGTKVFALEPSRRQALVIDASAQPKTTLVPTDTGKTDVVAGHSCSIAEVTEGTTKKTLCIARDLPRLRTNLGVTSGGKDWLPEFASGAMGFPLRIVVTDAHGAVLGKGQAVRIEAKSIPESRFVVPASYARVAAP